MMKEKAYKVINWSLTEGKIYALVDMEKLAGLVSDNMEELAVIQYGNDRVELETLCARLNERVEVVERRARLISDTDLMKVDAILNYMKEKMLKEAESHPLIQLGSLLVGKEVSDKAIERAREEMQKKMDEELTRERVIRNLIEGAYKGLVDKGVRK